MANEAPRLQESPTSSVTRTGYVRCVLKYKRVSNVSKLYVFTRTRSNNDQTVPSLRLPGRRFGILGETWFKLAREIMNFESLVKPVPGVKRERRKIEADRREAIEGSRGIA